MMHTFLLCATVFLIIVIFGYSLKHINDSDENVQRDIELQKQAIKNLEAKARILGAKHYRKHQKQRKAEAKRTADELNQAKAQSQARDAPLLDKTTCQEDESRDCAEVDEAESRRLAELNRKSKARETAEAIRHENLRWQTVAELRQEGMRIADEWCENKEENDHESKADIYSRIWLIILQYILSSAKNGAVVVRSRKVGENVENKVSDGTDVMVVEVVAPPSVVDVIACQQPDQPNCGQ